MAEGTSSIDPQAGRDPDRDFARYRATGDPACLGRVFDTVGPELLRLALHLVRPAAEAEDLLQHTFLRAIERRHAWRQSGPVRAWLAGILKNRAVDLHRRRLPDEKVDLEQLIDRAAPEDALLEAERSRELARCIDAVEEPYREALLLRLRHGLATADVAHVLGISPGAARMRLARGYERLRRLTPPAVATALLSVRSEGRGLARVRAAVLERATRAAPVPRAAPSGSPLAPAIGGLAMSAKLAVVLGLLVVATLLVLRLAAPRGPVAGPTPGASIARAETVGASGGAVVDEIVDAPRRVPAGPGDAVDAEGHDADEVSTLTVTLRGGEGTPGGIDVLVEATEGGPPVLRRARSDADGTVCLEGLPARRYTVRTGRNERREVELEAGVPCDVVLALERPFGVRVRVVDEDGRPVAGARIEAKDVNRGDPEWLGRALTDARGEARVQVAGWGATIRAAMAGRRASPFTIVPGTWGAEQAIELVLGPVAPALELRVVGPDGSAVRNAIVILDWEEQDLGDRFASEPDRPLEASDLKLLRMDRLPLRDGTARISCPPADAFDVWAVAPDLAPARRTVDRLADAGTVIEIALDAGSTLRGHVSAGGDDGVGGLEVRLYPRELIPVLWPQTTTDEDGSFELACLPAGEADLLIWRRGWTQRLAGRPLRFLPGRDSTVEIEILGRRWVEGVVVDREQRPVDGVWILITQRGARSYWYDAVQTSDEGCFRVPLPNVASLELQVRAPGQSGACLATVPMDVPPIDAPRIEVDRERLPSAWIEVPIPRGPDGARLCHRITVHRDGSPYGEEKMTDAPGVHRVGPLVPGRYAIEVHAQGYVQEDPIVVDVAAARPRRPPARSPACRRLRLGRRGRAGRGRDLPRRRAPGRDRRARARRDAARRQSAPVPRAG